MASTSHFQEEQIRYELAYAAYQRGDYSLAVSVFRQLVLIAPFEADYWRGLAAAEQMGLEYFAALHAWGLVALLCPQDLYPHFHAAECYLGLGDKQEAMKAIKVAESMCSDTHPLWLAIQTLREKII